MNIQLIAEIMGTVAFAISGAMLAIERKMDLFGIVFLGIVTAAGGGFIRDMTLGIVPPAMFSSPILPCRWQFCHRWQCVRWLPGSIRDLMRSFMENGFSGS